MGTLCSSRGDGLGAVVAVLKHPAQISQNWRAAALARTQRELLLAAPKTAASTRRAVPSAKGRRSIGTSATRSAAEMRARAPVHANVRACACKCRATDRERSPGIAVDEFALRVHLGYMLDVWELCQANLARTQDGG